MPQEVMTPPNNSKLNASFRQKSTGVSLVVIMAIAIYYFVNVFELLQAGALLLAGSLRLAITTLILIIVVEAALQSVLAIGAGYVPAPTKRDQDVALKATRNAYTLLVVGVVISFGSMFLNPSPFVMGNIMLLFFVLAEITKFASQLLYYRRSA